MKAARIPNTSECNVMILSSDVSRTIAKDVVDPKYTAMTRLVDLIVASECCAEPALLRRGKALNILTQLVGRTMLSLRWRRCVSFYDEMFCRW